MLVLPVFDIVVWISCITAVPIMKNALGSVALKKMVNLRYDLYDILPYKISHTRYVCVHRVLMLWPSSHFSLTIYS